MKITINKDSAVPIRDQLIEQIALQVAAGMLKQKEKLPSIRALADRLGIHYSTVTAAYNHLADAGLLEVRQGSGVRVAGRTSSTPTAHSKDELGQLLSEFLARVAEHGFSQNELQAGWERFFKKPPISRILAVDANVDFHQIILSELKPQFKLPVEACTIPELKAGNYEDALIVTSLYHLSSCQPLVKDLTRLVVCNVEPAAAEMGAVAALPAGKLVLLVSASETMMRIASKLIAAARGEEIPVRTVSSHDTNELTYMLKHADLVLCDRSSEAIVRAQPIKQKILTFNLYPQTTIDLINDRISKWG